MSKRIRVRITSRRPGDSPQLIKAIIAACPKHSELDLEIDSQAPAAAEIAQPRVDERLETEVNRELGSKLDALAQAVEEHKAGQQQAEADLLRQRADDFANRRRNIKKWFTDTASAMWTGAVKAVTEVLIKASGH